MAGGDNIKRLAELSVAPASAAESWREEYWFPVASVHELNPKRPTPVKIDGLALVVWQVPHTHRKKIAVEGGVDDDGGNLGWRVFADVCPHRLAPLSEGRIELATGNLQCSYHGWEFDGEGHCKSIPTADIESCNRACSLPRSRAVGYPVKVAYSVIWAWLGTSEPRGAPEDVLRGSNLEGKQVHLSYTRDLHYGYDTLVENLMDPGHVPFAHHGIFSSRDDAMPIALKMDTSKPNSLSFDFPDKLKGKERNMRFDFRAPFLMWYTPTNGKPISFYACVPQSPGRSRLILTYLFQMKMPVWQIHLSSNKFIDSDLIFLHHQERNLRFKPNREAEKWQTAYYMPAKVDLAISWWRRWLSKQGARCVAADYELPPSPNREVLLDRFEQHTQHCLPCQERLEALAKRQKVLAKVGLVALILDRLPPYIWLLLGRSLAARRDRGGGGLVGLLMLRFLQLLQLCGPLFLGTQVLALGDVVRSEMRKREFHFVDHKHYNT